MIRVLTSKQTIVQVSSKDMLVFGKENNTDSLKIFQRVTLTFRLNNSKWKALY